MLNNLFFAKSCVYLHPNITITNSWAKTLKSFFNKIKTEAHYGGGMETALSHIRPALL